MNRYRHLRFLLVVIAIFALAAPARALAYEQRSGTNVVVSEPVSDDLFLFGNNIEVTANVDGDIFAFGKTITISGDVSGTVVAAGETVQVLGPVSGSVRAAGQDVEIGGVVSRDVMLSGATLRVTQDGSVGRDALLGGQDITLSGNVGRDVRAAGNSLIIESAVGRNVHAAVQNLTVAEGASVAGDLDYTSNQQASVQGQVAGQTTRHQPRTRKTRTTFNPALAAFLSVVAWIRGLIGILLLGVAIILLDRKGTVIASDVLRARPWPSLGIGALVFFGVWPVAGTIFVLGLLVGGWWISFALLSAVWLLMLIGAIVGGLALGRLLLRWMKIEWHPMWAMILGILVIWIVGVIPFVGWLLGFAAVVFGTGATTIALFAATRHPAEQVPATSPPPPLQYVSTAGMAPPPQPPIPPGQTPQS